MRRQVTRVINDAVPSYAYDDDFIEASRRDGRTRVRVYRLTSPVVVLGSGSKLEMELHLDACQADNIPIVRRYGGGCAVLLDPGNIIVSVAATGLPFGHHQRHFDTLTEWLIRGLDSIGFPGVSQAGICDLCLGEHKIGGACLHRSRDLLYYSVTLLVDPDWAGITRYLKHPPREPAYRRGRPHAEFMRSLRSITPGGESNSNHAMPNMESVAAGLRRVLNPPDLLASASQTSSLTRDSKTVLRPARFPVVPAITSMGVRVEV